MKNLIPGIFQSFEDKLHTCWKASYNCRSPGTYLHRCPLLSQKMKVLCLCFSSSSHPLCSAGSQLMGVLPAQHSRGWWRQLSLTQLGIWEQGRKLLNTLVKSNQSMLLFKLSIKNRTTKCYSILLQIFTLWSIFCVTERKLETEENKFWYTKCMPPRGGPVPNNNGKIFPDSSCQRPQSIHCLPKAF